MFSFEIHLSVISVPSVSKMFKCALNTGNKNSAKRCYICVQTNCIPCTVDNRFNDILRKITHCLIMLHVPNLERNMSRERVVSHSCLTEQHYVPRITISSTRWGTSNVIWLSLAILHVSTIHLSTSATWHYSHPLC
jgi:hypothetical protein